MGLYTDPDYFEKQSSYQESKKSKVIKSIRDHFIRPCYLRESETPLKFYKLIRVCLPIGAILNFFRAIQATVAISTAAEAAKPYFIIDAIYIWLGIVLLLGAAAGLNRMEWSGVRFYSALFGWQIVYNAFLAILGAHWGLFDFEYFGRPIMEAVFLSVWLYFCLIYFGKRRLLFSPGAFNDPPEWTPSPDGEPAFHDQSARNSITPPKVEPEPPSEPEITAESNPPAVIPEKPVKKAAPRALVIGLVVALALSLAGNVWQSLAWNAEKKEFDSELKGKDQEISNLKSANISLKSEISDLETYRADTYYTTGYIVSGSNYYHRYDCPVFKAANTYQSHNTKFCEWLGYSACPVCKSGFLINFNSKMPQQSAP